MKKILFLLLTMLIFIGNAKAVINDYIDNAGTLDYDAAIENGYIEMKTRKPNSDKEFEVFLMYSGLTGGESMSRDNCNAEYTECEITLKQFAEDEVRMTMEFRYPELDEDVLNRVAEYEKEYKNLPLALNGGEGSRLFSITDLDVLNFYYFRNDLYNEDGSYNIWAMNSSVKYMSDFKKTYGNSNIEPLYFNHGCNLWYEGFDNSDTFGDLFLLYDDIVYGYILIDLEYLNIIYVPSDTPTDEESTLAAAKERIENYFGEEFEFEVSRPVTDDNDGYWPSENLGIEYFGDRENMSENIYFITINGIQFEFLIIRDSSKMIDSNVVTADLKSDISVEIDNLLVPKDTAIGVEEIKDNDDIKDILGKENVYTFDISLYSETIDEYITETDGKFIVKIPVPEEFEGKTLIVEFIKEDGTIETHEVEVVDGYACFETTHFSVYSLSELATDVNPAPIPTNVSNKEETPDTGDSIVVTFIVMIASMIFFIITKKKLNEI